MFLTRLPSLATSAFSSSGTNGFSPRPPLAPSLLTRRISSSYEPALLFLTGWAPTAGSCAGRRVGCSAAGTLTLDCGQGMCGESPGVRRPEGTGTDGHGDR